MGLMMKERKAVFDMMREGVDREKKSPLGERAARRLYVVSRECAVRRFGVRFAAPRTLPMPYGQCCVERGEGGRPVGEERYAMHQRAADE